MRAHVALQPYLSQLLVAPKQAVPPGARTPCSVRQFLCHDGEVSKQGREELAQGHESRTPF